MTYKTFLTTIATIVALTTCGLTAQAAEPHYKHSSGLRADVSIGYERQSYEFGSRYVETETDYNKEDPAYSVAVGVGYDFYLRSHIFAGVEVGLKYAGNELCSFKEPREKCVTMATTYSAIGRFGWQGEKSKVYALGGAVFGERENRYYKYGKAHSSHPYRSNMDTGYVLGVGWQRDISEHLYTKLEYRFSSFGAYEDAERHALSVGVGYQF